MTQSVRCLWQVQIPTPAERAAFPRAAEGAEHTGYRSSEALTLTAGRVDPRCNR